MQCNTENPLIGERKEKGEKEEVGERAKEKSNHQFV